MTTAGDIAKYVVRFFQEAGDPVTNLKLQKLLYYVQGWHLALKDGPAFPERLEAWIHGPVQPSTYGAYKHYRWLPITDSPGDVELPDEAMEIVNSVIESYGGETGYQLELRTHQEPPWLQARNGIPLDQESQAVISTDSMKQFFLSLADGKEAK